MNKLHFFYQSISRSLGKYRQSRVFLTLLALFFTIGLYAQGGQCTGITFSFEPYEDCKFRARYSNQSDCFIEIRYILASGEFASWNVNAAAGYELQVVSPSELWITHSNSFLPLGDQVPLLFTLPPDLNTTIGISYLDNCAQVGCELIGGIPIESCPDPRNASIIGVKYRECGALPYINQTPLSDWVIQLMDADGNILQEGETDADGNYAFYDLPKGQYICRELQQPGWTPKVPASGEYIIDLDASEQRIVNFGNCPPPSPPCDCPAGTQPGANQVVNGNFSGSGGFNTGYALNNTPVLQPGQYWIGSDPSQINAGFAACGDHTSGSGNMMVVNGAPNQNTTIWSQTFTLPPNSTYKFEAWVASLTNASPAHLIVNFQVNNVMWGQSFFAPNTTCIWENFCRTWNNGSANPITLTVNIVNDNAASAGNDFAIDDISFRRCVLPNGAISGRAYLTCDSMAYTNQPVLGGQTVQLLDTLGNLILEQVTDTAGIYGFYDLPQGVYWVGVLQQGDYQPNYPASGLSVIELEAGDVETQDLGLCSGCGCDSITTVIHQFADNADTSLYLLSYMNSGADCFPYLDIKVETGDILNWAALLPGWIVEQISNKTLRAIPSAGFLPEGAFTPLQVRVYGGTQHRFNVTNGTGVLSCLMVSDFIHPPLIPSPTCCLNSTFIGPELVLNGDFTNNTAPSSDYTFGNGGPGFITIKNQNQIFNTTWQCVGKTGPSDNFLVVDGALVGGQVAWKQQVTVTPGSEYVFCAQFNNLFKTTLVSSNPFKPVIRMWIEDVSGNTVAMSPPHTLGETPDAWVNLSLSWLSPLALAGPYTLKISTQTTFGYGNDFTVDCISFRSCTPPPCQVAINVSQNADCSVTVCAVGSGAQPISYQWCDGRTGACFTTAQTPCVPTTYCVTATCADGSTSTATVVYTVQDITPPVAVCNPGIGIDLGNNCNFQVTPAFVDGGSTDNCGIQSMSVSPTTLAACTNTIVTLTVTDFCGNISSCTMGVQTIEGVPPTAVCYGGISVQLDATCSASIGVSDVDGGSTDNCQIVSRVINPSAFTQCGTSVVTLTVTDECSNTATCSMPVNVVDIIPPTIACPPNTTLNTSLPDCIAYGNASLNPIVSDNCGVGNTVYLTSGATNTSGLGNINGVPFNHGMTTVIYAVQDLCNNTAQCSFKVTVECSLDDCDCPGNMVQNPGFSLGAIEGNLGNPGASANWTTASGSPQVTNTIYCCDPYSMQMWGNQDLGESIAQGGFNFQPGNTYRISFKAKFFDQNLPANYVRIGFTAANGIVDPFTCATACENMGETGNITNQVCNTYTLPDWTVSGSGPWNTLIIRAFNNTPDQPGDPNTISWARIDNICITEVEKDCVDPPQGMVSWWGMDDQDGDVLALDLVGPNAATPMPGGVIGLSSPFSTAGKVGTALSFVSPPGTMHLSVPDHASQNFGTGSFSIDAWILTPGGTQTEPIVDKLGNSFNGYSFSVQSSFSPPFYPTLVLGTGTGLQVLQGPPITVGDWNLVSVSVDAQQSMATFCVGDVSTGTFSSSSVPITAYNASSPGRPLLIGYNQFNPHWNITIDELEIFDRAVSTAEFQAIFEADTLGKCKDIVAVKDLSKAFPLRIFPNPNPGSFTVEMPEPARPGTLFRITDLAGRLVQEQKTEPGNTQQTVRATELPTGLYFLQVVSEGKVLAVEKFVKQ